jgi:hypothetical protein
MEMLAGGMQSAEDRSDDERGGAGLEGNTASAAWPYAFRQTGEAAGQMQ